MRRSAAPRQLDGVRLLVAAEKRNARFCCVLLQLVEGAGSETVSTDEGGLPRLALIMPRVPEGGKRTSTEGGWTGTSRGKLVGRALLGASGRLAAALQAYKHNHIGAAFFGNEGLHSWIQHAAQLVENRFLNDPALVHTAA